MEPGRLIAGRNLIDGDAELLLDSTEHFRGSLVPLVIVGIRGLELSPRHRWITRRALVLDPEQVVLRRSCKVLSEEECRFARKALGFPPLGVSTIQEPCTRRTLRLRSLFDFAERLTRGAVVDLP